MLNKLALYITIIIISTSIATATPQYINKYDPWVYSIISVTVVSIIALIGIITFAIKDKYLKKIVIYLLSFSAGVLLGDTFIHLLPEIVADYGFDIKISLYILMGILVSFFIEKVIHWSHYHDTSTRKHIHPFAYLNLIGDAVHNFLDGMIIGASYLVSLPVGIATTFAVIFHEIPQEIGDFGVLIHGGFSKSKALFLNFITALTSVIGALVAISLSNYFTNLTQILIPIAAGNFIYIASADLIPELHKETKIKNSAIQIFLFSVGILVMYLLRLF